MNSNNIHPLHPEPRRAVRPMFAEAASNWALRLARGGDEAVVDVVTDVVRQASALRASDVHFEPWQDGLGVRFRIDGLLHEAAILPKQHHARLIARIKILARIVTYQRETPQDGRIDAEATPLGKAMRVSTFPTVEGEKAVLRILDAAQNMLALDELGMNAATLRGLRTLTSRPHGAILLTGPSSSGKTTTIYAMIRDLLNPERCDGRQPHVVTIEDPVEYKLGHVSQTEVQPHHGLTYEAALRAVLRQDPEVIVLGEIRDPETARTAIQAGLTGHLVISTIHSGTAAGVFTRLLDMGVEPFLIASAVSGVLSQRLVRRICPECADGDLDDTGRVASTQHPPPLRGTPFKGGTSSGSGLQSICFRCGGIGYHGRFAVAELLTMNDVVSDLVLSRSRTRAIHEAAVAGGMVPIDDDAAARVEQGTTTWDEVRRVLPPRIAPESASEEEA